MTKDLLDWPTKGRSGKVQRSHTAGFDVAVQSWLGKCAPIRRVAFARVGDERTGEAGQAWLDLLYLCVWPMLQNVLDDEEVGIRKGVGQGVELSESNIRTPVIGNVRLYDRGDNVDT